MPINMDLLFLTYGAFFYGYGVYLHWGFELRYPDVPPPLDQHELPALRAPRASTFDKPMHTGFFFKLWDQLAKSEYQAGPETCLCAKCCRARGERTREAFEAIEKPDYSVLLSPSFWWHGGRRASEELPAE
jgi:lathosterol oxidase